MQHSGVVYLSNKEASTVLCFVFKQVGTVEHERSVGENTRRSQVFLSTSCHLLRENL